MANSAGVATATFNVHNPGGSGSVHKADLPGHRPYPSAPPEGPRPPEPNLAHW